MSLALGEKQELFAKLVPRLIDEAHAQGFSVRLGETLRFYEQAEYNATHCRDCKKTKSRHLMDHPFKPIGIRDSLHCKKLAIDIILFKNNSPCWGSEEYEALHDFWETLNPLCAKRIKWDGGHFSIGHGGKR